MSSVSTFPGEVQNFILTKRLVSQGDTVVLAVSGGVDSMVMLDVFHEIRRSWNLDLVIAHVNHRLRGEESDQDELFVRQAAARYGIPIHCAQADVHGRMHSGKISKQEAAREIRYEFFEEVRRQSQAHRVATAHQADDNAETVLLNIMRGTGVRGLAGIPTARPDAHVIRPLLFASREKILSYAGERRIAFRNDSSNESNLYTRNYLRRNIVPFLKQEFGPDVCDSLNRLSETMKGFADFLDQLVDLHSKTIVTASGTGCTVVIPAFIQEPEFLQAEIVLRILRRFGVEPGVSKVNDILRLSQHQTGHSLQISGRMTVTRDREQLRFQADSPTPELDQSVAPGQSFAGPGFVLTVGEPEPVPQAVPADHSTEYIDAEKLDSPLVVRTWKHGDWFVPLGMRGKKKLSDFFGDEKISGRDKKRIPILESHDNIVWVCGRRLDDRYKITPKTRRAIKLTYVPTTPPEN